MWPPHRIACLSGGGPPVQREILQHSQDLLRLTITFLEIMAL